ncbi:asparagine synthetase B [Polynucleobacter sp. es-EL-1]|uniref:asparagine synthetase B family protein n=1 Tax=Polynucleobacter sp. es-EL-1 TaxID=1855652 RepID=UPI001BFDA82D|nr:asparagine synthetase B [Polynucleobacter sp. es-EL-1]QWE11334.1 hypothetical protein FD974_04210 [Polynucleobacter sp. es-EL-1]
MNLALSYWGSDGGGLFCEKQIGLGSRLLHITAEDHFEHQPLIVGSLCLVARVRLDNRSELCQTLGLKNNPHLPDSQILMAAYRYFGQACVDYLEGDWSFALWDSSDESLFIARDASGNTGLYYWWNGSQLVFSNGLKGILAHPEFEQQINPAVIADLLTVSHHSEIQAQTVYTGIKRLLPGNCLLLKQGILKIFQWWNPERLDPLNFSNPKECYAEFQTLYEKVVREQLRIGDGQVAATLSGGLDSGSVVSLAAPKLNVKSAELTAFVHVPLYVPTSEGHTRTGNEIQMATATAQFVGNVNIVPILSEKKTLLWGLKRGLEIHDAPGHAASNYFWLFDIQEQAQAMNARVLLTGQMGNATISYSGDGNLWPEIRRGQWKSVISELLCDSNGVLKSLKRRIIRPILLPLLLHWRNRKVNNLSYVNDYSYINPDFANEIKIHQGNNCRGLGLFTSFFQDPSQDLIRQFRLGLLGGGASGALWMEAGAAHHLDVRDPTRDRRIIEFCWRLPDSIFWAGGVKRGLIRKGLANYLPLDVLTSTKKGLQVADIHERLKNELPEFLALANELAMSSAADYVDMTRIKDDLGTMNDGNLPSLQKIQGLIRSIQVAMFIRNMTSRSA